jgi:hypothetical protein
VYALAVHEGELVAGGSFTTAGGAPALGVAAWDGATWRPLGGGIAGGDPIGPAVYALRSWNGDLIAGGYFTTAGGAPASHIARWDGVAWNAMAGGMDDWVTSLVVDGTSLAVGGRFTSPARRVALWSGSSWSSVGSGFGNTVAALGTLRGDLVAGGYFTQGIRRFDGVNWLQMDSGTGGASDPILSMVEIPDGLFVGGNFERTGGWNVDLWLEAAVGVTGHDAPFEDRAGPSLAIRPSPFSERVEIVFDVPRPTHARLSVYDVTGRLVDTIVDQAVAPGAQHLFWNARARGRREAPAGVYFLRLETDHGVETAKMVRVR